MKRQYIKPQTRTVTLKLFGAVLDTTNAGWRSASNAVTNLTEESRRGNFLDDEEEPIEDSMWK